MSLPEFTSSGDLPPGIHVTSLQDAIDRFGAGSRRRGLLARRLERVHALAASTGLLGRFVVFGSFVTDKAGPRDVDVFMLMDDRFNVAHLWGDARLLFDHAAAQNHFGCSVFWLRWIAAFGGVEATIENWQVKRDGTLRGIVEIEAESP